MVNEHRSGRSCPARVALTCGRHRAPAYLLFITAFSSLRHDALGFHSGGAPIAASRTALNVLSPRQLQFWEDVEGKEFFSDHCATSHS
jgi:hypothetical protein